MMIVQSKYQWLVKDDDGSILFVGYKEIQCKRYIFMNTKETI